MIDLTSVMRRDFPLRQRLLFRWQEGAMNYYNPMALHFIPYAPLSGTLSRIDGTNVLLPLSVGYVLTRISESKV